MTDLTKIQLHSISTMIEKTLKGNDATEADINQLIGICSAMDWMAGCYSDEVNKGIIREKFRHYRTQLIHYKGAKK